MYVVFVGMAGITLALLCFTLEIKEQRQQRSIERFTLKEEERQEEREVLLTRLSEFTSKNINSKDQLQQYFGDKEEKIFSYKRSYIKYSKEEDLFIIAFHFDDIYHREERYRYGWKEKSIKLFYIGTKIKEGKV